MEKIKSEDPIGQIKVAKITAFQAILVALITASAGIVGGILVSNSNNASHVSCKTQWIIIKGIENLDDKNGETAARIIVNINGYSVSYPSRNIFAIVGPHMSEERFPIITDDRGYKISFSALVNYRIISDPYATEELNEQLSQQIEIIKSNQIPTGNRYYDLYPVYSGLRGENPKLRIKYSIE